jgi:hypothetical protein
VGISGLLETGYGIRLGRPAATILAVNKPRDNPRRRLKLWRMKSRLHGGFAGQMEQRLKSRRRMVDKVNDRSDRRSRNRD